MLDKQPIRTAKLNSGEKHLYSFEGRLCEWETKLFFWTIPNNTPIAIEGAYFQGHITNKRLLIEGRYNNSGALFAGKVGLNILEKIVENSIVKVASGLADTLAEGNEKARALTEGKGYLSFPYVQLDCLKCWNDNVFWPVLRTNKNGRDPAFMPYNPGTWSSSLAYKEFAAIMKKYVRIVEYKP